MLSLSPSRIWFQVAGELKPSLTHWVAPLLYFFARLIEAKETVEIGIGRGYSSFALGAYAKDFNGNHTVIDWSAGRKIVAHKLNNRYGLHIDYIKANARTYNWEKEKPIDLLFVDILGSEASFLDIFSRFTPAVKRHGIIMVHDYFCFGYIKSAVDLYFKNKDGFEMITIPADGEPRMQPELEGPCGLAIIVKK